MPSASPAPRRSRANDLAAGALVCFAALMGFDLPSVPIPGHAAWADVLAAVAVLLSLLSWLRGDLTLEKIGGAVPCAFGYAGWATLSALAHGRADAGWKVLGVCELVAIFTVAGALIARYGAVLRDRIVRAWTWGAVVLGVAGVAIAACASFGFDVSPLHLGDGDLGWRFRPAGLQRVGLLAELCLAPLIFACFAGKQWFGARRHAVRAVLGAVVMLTCTRTIVAALVAFAMGGIRNRGLKVLALSGLAITILVAARFDPYGRAAHGMRWRIAQAALHSAITHPGFGVGPSGDVAIVGGPAADDVPRPWDAHDTALDVSARYGLPALLFLAGTALSVWRRRETGDASSRAIELALLATAFDSFSVELADGRHVWLLMALAGSRPLLAARTALHVPPPRSR